MTQMNPLASKVCQATTYYKWCVLMYIALDLVVSVAPNYAEDDLVAVSCILLRHLKNSDGLICLSFGQSLLWPRPHRRREREKVNSVTRHVATYLYRVRTGSPNGRTTVERQ